MANYNKGAESITQAEHISPDKTGDNIEAKRIAHYGWDYTNQEWVRIGAVESTATPGVFGLVIVNADGSAVSGGGGGTTDGTFDFMDGNDFQFMDGNSAAFMSG